MSEGHHTRAISSQGHVISVFASTCQSQIAQCDDAVSFTEHRADRGTQERAGGGEDGKDGRMFVV